MIKLTARKRLVKPVKSIPLVKRSTFFQFMTLSIILMSFLFALRPPYLGEDLEPEPASLSTFPTSFSRNLVSQPSLKKQDVDNQFYIYKNSEFVFNISDSNEPATIHWLFEINNTRQETAPVDIYLDNNWFTHVEINSSKITIVDIPVSLGNHVVQFNIWTWQVRQYFHEYFYHDFADEQDRADVLTIRPENGITGEKVIDYIFVKPAGLSPSYFLDRKNFIEAAVDSFDELRQIYLDMSYGSFTFKLGAVIGWFDTNLTYDWIDKNHENASVDIIKGVDQYYSFKDTDLVAIFYLTARGSVATGYWGGYTTNDGGPDFPHTFYGRITIPAHYSGLSEIIAHELGHSFALGHPTLRGSFTDFSFSLMGYAGRLMLGFYRYALSWLDIEIINSNQTITNLEMVSLSHFTSEDRLMVLKREKNGTAPAYYVLEYRTWDENPGKAPYDVVVLYEVKNTVFELARNRDRYDGFLGGITVVSEWIQFTATTYDEFYWTDANNQSDMSFRIWWPRYDRPVIWLNDRLGITVNSTERW